MPVVFFDEVFAQQARSTKQIITNDVIENVRCVLLEEFDEDEVKQSFINACVRHQDDISDNKERIKEKICVKTFMENDTCFLGLKERENK